ncbi:MAG TPA: CHAT domain-containing protein, partial [Candidatus Polarisedimenticolaceae bacterium]|nr:CHAT domain-containing protein [Candidatus Polarisedimenticolaceae bacterium]
RSALVSYFRHEEEGGGYVASVLLPGDAPPQILPLGGAAGVDAAVKLWRDLVSKDPRAGGPGEGEDAYRQAARRLAELIWDPVAPLLGDADRVLVVPDGTLHEVSLATLVPSGGGYLVDSDLSFHYLTAERDLVGAQESPSTASGLLAVGDPAYGTRFSPLPGSRLEVLDVAGRWAAPTTILLGKDAQESAFKELAPSFGVLHVAAHAFFPLGEESDESPLRVAGVVLSGGSDASDPDDGILTAEEVSLLDLRAVRWAVLSGCATGTGALEPGEGVLGLRRAFQLAGARTVIVSLWPIEDDATRHWMRALYTARRAGASTVDAVRAAVRDSLQDQRRTGGTTHPYFWGGFVSIGDWR